MKKEERTEWEEIIEKGYDSIYCQCYCHKPSKEEPESKEDIKTKICQIIYEMLGTFDSDGLYPTEKSRAKCFKKLESFIISEKNKSFLSGLKELL